MDRRQFLFASSALASAAMTPFSSGCGQITDVEPTRQPPRIEVVDLMPALFAFLDQNAGQPADVMRARFLAEVVGAQPEVYASSVIGAPGYGDEGFFARVDRFLSQAPDTLMSMRQIHEDFSSGFDASRARFVTALPDFDWQGRVYLFASLDGFHGAGRMVGEHAALLFGLDVIARDEPERELAVLFHHELFHMYQAQAEAYLGEMMWVEGLATYASIALNPGTSDEQALPLSHVHDPEAPVLDNRGRAVSLAEVMPGLVDELGPMLRARLRSTEARGGANDYAMFFLGRAAPDYPDGPVRAGYWFGLEIVRRLAAGRSLRELGALSPASLIDEIDAALAAMIAAA